MASKALALEVHDPSVLPIANTPAVLVADSDPNSLAICTTMLNDLGYRHFGATSAREALELLGTTPAIQILIANVHMPAMDGIALIEEVRARMCEIRPVATVMLAEKASVELAVKGMHLEAVDLLTKPFGLEPYSAALRRAIRYLGTRRATSDGASMSHFGQHLTRLLAVLENNNNNAAGQHIGTRSENRATDKEIAATLRCVINSRSLRSRFFPSDIFADPAWDILLDLTRAHLDNQDVSVSSVCIAASVPMSTALRWVRHMTEAGLLQRWTDPRDRRRDLIALTEKTRVNMMEFLTIVHGTMKKV